MRPYVLLVKRWFIGRGWFVGKEAFCWQRGGLLAGGSLLVKRRFIGKEVVYW